MDDAQLTELSRHVQGLILDVDGVLTDGRITYADDGTESKHFHVRDGASLNLLQAEGIPVAIITGRSSPMVARRAEELQIRFLVQGAASKEAALHELIEQGFPANNLAAIGDDLQDLQLFQSPAVTLKITVADAHPVVIQAADFTTHGAGGSGVTAEIATLLLTAQGKWPF